MICVPFIYYCSSYEESKVLDKSLQPSCHLQVDQYFTGSAKKLTTVATYNFCHHPRKTFDEKLNKQL